MGIKTQLTVLCILSGGQKQSLNDGLFAVNAAAAAVMSGKPTKKQENFARQTDTKVYRNYWKVRFSLNRQWTCFYSDGTARRTGSFLHALAKAMFLNHVFPTPSKQFAAVATDSAENAHKLHSAIATAVAHCNHL